MTLQELEWLIAQGEGESLEFKETTGQRRDACETLCAFLNGRGGTVVFGVSRKGKLVGQLVADTTRRDLFEVFDKFEPVADIETEWINVDATHQAIVCRVERGNCRPYVYDGRPYRRVQSSTTTMPQEEYSRMLQERGGFRSDWDLQPSQNLTLDEIDLDEVVKTAHMAISVGRLDSSVDASDAVGLLRKFKVMKQDQLLNGAAVLFGNSEMAYPQCQIKMARFRGTGKNEFGDERRVVGNVFVLLDAAMQFCFKHLNLAGRVKGFFREEQLELPPEALREAILNALAHRQYSRNAAISLAIYDDRLEISSPGGLPPNKTVAILAAGCESEPRNAVIANVLYLRKAIESWGRGFGLMREECIKHGVLPPVVEETLDGFVKVVFARPTGKVAQKSGKVAQKSGEVAQKGDEVAQELTADGSAQLKRKIGTLIDTVLPALRRDARRRVDEILFEIALNAKISSFAVAKSVGVSRRTVNNILTLLKSAGILYRIGADRGGHWVINWHGNLQTA